MIYSLIIISVLLILVSYEFYRFYSVTQAKKGFSPYKIWIGEQKGWTIQDEDYVSQHKEVLKVIKKKIDMDLASLPDGLHNQSYKGDDLIRLQGQFSELLRVQRELNYWISKEMKKD